MLACLLGEPDEIREMLDQPLVKAFALQMTGESFRSRGFQHPMGNDWGGIQDLEPDWFSREDLLAFIAAVDKNALLALVPHGTPQELAREIKAYADAGVRVLTILDYGGMAGLKFGAQNRRTAR